MLICKDGIAMWQNVDDNISGTADNGNKIKLELQNLRTVHLLCRINIYDNGLSIGPQLSWLNMQSNG